MGTSSLPRHYTQKKGEGQYTDGAVQVPFRFADAASRRIDVIGIGQNSVDLIAVVDQFPRPDSKQELRMFETMPGGQIATAAAAAARLGRPAAYIGRFGGAALGAVARAGLERAGVD